VRKIKQNADLLDSKCYENFGYEEKNQKRNKKCLEEDSRELSLKDNEETQSGTSTTGIQTNIKVMKRFESSR